MYSYENTYNEKQVNGIRTFICLHYLILGLTRNTYQKLGMKLLVTHSSSIFVVKKDKQYGYSKAAAEVCKYALKFGDLSVEHTWEAFKVLKGKRLSGAFGSLWGVKIPENLADDMPDEKDLPYLEMLYRFVFGKKSYYDLEMTRHVEPQANDRQSEEKEERRPTDTTGENERVAMTDGAYLSEGRAFVPLRLGALSVKSNVGDFHLKPLLG